MNNDLVDQTKGQWIKPGNIMVNLTSMGNGFLEIERRRQEIWYYIQYRESLVTWPSVNEKIKTRLSINKGEQSHHCPSLSLEKFKIWVLILSVFMLTIVLVVGRVPASSVEKDGKKLEMKKLLPLEVGSYKTDGKDQFYDRNTTFRYMDGAAELYRSFAFKLLMVRRYVKVDRPPIMVELFDMGSPEDAFGVFSFETEGEDVGVGQESDYGGGLLRFWKGKFFANVYAEQEASSPKQDVLEMGRVIAISIKQEGQKPKLINYLLGESLSERSIRYFHLHQSLNYHYFVSHENILHLGKQTNAVLATYFPAETKDKTFLLLIQYPARKLAGEALKSFTKAYMPESSASRVIQTENGRWASAQSYQEFVIVVFDAPHKEKAEALIQATRKNLEVGRP